jgi:hypothetical protein
LLEVRGVARRVIALVARVRRANRIPNAAAGTTDRELLFAGVADRRNLNPRADSVDVLARDVVMDVRSSGSERSENAGDNSDGAGKPGYENVGSLRNACAILLLE